MASYQHSADIAGNLIASGAGFATLLDYAKLGVLYLQNGMWDGEGLLPQGWADYALTATHTGTSYRKRRFSPAAAKSTRRERLSGGGTEIRTAGPP
jgi:CubicO group peptidase (beta-lactamase class C family)